MAGDARHTVHGESLKMRRIMPAAVERPFSTALNRNTAEASAIASNHEVHGRQQRKQGIKGARSGRSELDKK
ncbi:MAG: hypothetical protein EOO65_02690 [Methanosarcinales archaeon]|nr:MAG: hypothetical protein EOO65_02690 [Methanosarcinales archaeon]